MVDTKSASEALENWKAAQGRVPEAYSKGVARAKNVTEKAIAGEALFAAKMQEAIANKSRAKGLEKSSDEKWRAAAQGKGAQRIAAGMAAAENEFSSGIAKVLSVIQGVSIPARVADPMANIDNRLKPIAKALHDMKGK